MLFSILLYISCTLDDSIMDLCSFHTLLSVQHLQGHLVLGVATEGHDYTKGWHNPIKGHTKIKPYQLEGCPAISEL